MSFVTHEQQSLVWLASPLLGGVRHGFSTRRGGVSPAPWDTLNLGPGRGDAPENVRGELPPLLRRPGVVDSAYRPSSPGRSTGTMCGSAPPPTPGRV